MIQFNVSKELNVTMMNANGSKWAELLRRVEDILSETTDSINLDFENIQLISAQENEQFLQLLLNDRVYMTVYANAPLAIVANHMRTMGWMGKSSSDNVVRIKNIDYIVKELSVKEKKIINFEKTFMGKIDENREALIDGRKFRIPITGIITQMSAESTVDAIENVIKKLNSEYENKYDYIIDLTDINIADHVRKCIAGKICSLEANGIHVEVDSDSETMKSINALKLVGLKDLTYEERVMIIESALKLNMVGMLSQFKAYKSVEIMHRIKDNKPIMCRVAVFKGIDRKAGKAVFDTIPLDYLKTRLDYVMDNDCDEHPGLNIERKVVDIMSLGVEEKSIGKLWHFNSPLQLNTNAVYTLWKEGDDGKLHRERVSLPVYIKAILDDHGVEYNRDKLLWAIEETKKECGL